MNEEIFLMIAEEIAVARWKATAPESSPSDGGIGLVEVPVPQQPPGDDTEERQTMTDFLESVMPAIIDAVGKEVKIVSLTHFECDVYLVVFVCGSDARWKYMLFSKTWHNIVHLKSKGLLFDPQIATKSPAPDAPPEQPVEAKQAEPEAVSDLDELAIIEQDNVYDVDGECFFDLIDRLLAKLRRKRGKQ